MHLGNLLNWWTILIFSLISPTWALKGDSWCGTLLCVDAIVNGSTVTYELKALNQLGWMSIGFGPHMAGAPLVILWPNADGSVTLSQRVADGHVPPKPDPDPPRIATLSAHVDLSSDTSPILAFDIPVDNTNTTQSLIWAFGVARPEPESAADIDQHLDAGAFSLDLSKDRDKGKDKSDTSSSLISTSSSLFSTTTPFAPTSPTPAGASLTTSHAVSSTSSLSSTSALPQAQPLDSPFLHERTRRNVVVAHAVLSFLGFCVFLPASAIITRWLRTASPYSLRIHWCVVAFLAVPTGTIGWALGPAAVALHGQRHVANEHSIAGVILFAICLLQATLGLFIHRRQPKHGRIHPLRNYAHVVIGLAIIGLSFFVAKTGLDGDVTLGTSLGRDLSVACIIISVLVALAYLTGVVRLRRQFDQERLGWHLSLASSSTTTRTGLFGHQREARRSSRTGQRGGIDRTDDEPRDARRRSTSSSGPGRQEVQIGMPLSVEMRELQSAVPVSATLRTQYVIMHS